MAIFIDVSKTLKFNNELYIPFDCVYFDGRSNQVHITDFTLPYIIQVLSDAQYLRGKIMWPHTVFAISVVWRHHKTKEVVCECSVQYEHFSGPAVVPDRNRYIQWSVYSFLCFFMHTISFISN